MFPNAQAPANNNFSAQAPVQGMGGATGFGAGMPQAGAQPGMGRHTGLIGMGQLAAENPNPVTQIQSPQHPEATTAGIMQAFNKMGSFWQRARSSHDSEYLGQGVTDASLGGRVTSTVRQELQLPPESLYGNYSVVKTGHVTQNHLERLPYRPLISPRPTGSVPPPVRTASPTTKKASLWLGLLQKAGAQDNSAPQRSATGDSTLSFNDNPDNYSQGMAAWKSITGKFSGGDNLKTDPDPTQGKHRGTEKVSFFPGFVGGTIGAGYGLVNGPKGEKSMNAAHNGIVGAGTEVGATLGAGTGLGLSALALHHLQGANAGGLAQNLLHYPVAGGLTLGAGLLGGGVLGGMAGNRLGQALMGKSPARRADEAESAMPEGWDLKNLNNVLKVHRVRTQAEMGMSDADVAERRADGIHDIFPTEKKAVLIGGALGAAYGAGEAPEGQTGMSMLHGAARGAGTELGVYGGMGVGAGLGAAAAYGLGQKMDGAVSPLSRGLLHLGVHGGAVLGGMGGYKLTNYLLGKSPGQKKRETEKKAEVLPLRAVTDDPDFIRNWFAYYMQKQAEGVNLGGMTSADVFGAQQQQDQMMQQQMMAQQQPPQQAPPGMPPAGGGGTAMPQDPTAMGGAMPPGMPPQQPGMPPAQPGMPPQGGGMAPPPGGDPSAMGGSPMMSGMLPPAQPSPVGPGADQRMDLIGAQVGAPDGAHADMGAENFMKGAEFNNYQRGFFTRCRNAGMNTSQVKTAIDQVHEKFGADISGELYEGFEKLAGKLPGALGIAAPFMDDISSNAPNIIGGAQKLWGGAKNMFGKAKGMFSGPKPPVPVPPAPAASAWTGAGASVAKAPNPWTQAANNMGHEGTALANIPKPRQWAPLGGYGATGARMGAGAMTGYNMGEVDSNSSLDNLAGMGAGAMFGRYMPRMPANMQAAGTRAMGGSLAGFGTGQTAEMLGAPQGTAQRMAQMGGFAGAGSAFMPSRMQNSRAGTTVGDFSRAANGSWMPGSIANNMRNGSMGTRLGTMAGPVPGAAMVGAGATAATVMGGRAAYNAAGGAISNSMQSLGKDYGKGAAQGGIEQFKSFIQSPEANSLIEDKLKSTFGVGTEEIKKALASGQQGMQWLQGMGDWPDKILGMFMGKDQLANMNPMMKWTMLIGGGLGVGALAGGALTGNRTAMGLGAAGLGGAALMGGFPHLFGGAQAPPQQPPQAEAANPGRPDAYSWQNLIPGMSPSVIPPPRNELTTQQNYQQQ